MIVPILTGIGLFFLFIVVGGGYLLYTLITKQNMNSEIKTKALDVFVYLGIGISLVVSVTNIIQILFTAIEKRFVDVLANSGAVDAYSSDVRLAVASLFVMYPIYVALSWYVAKDISTFLYKRDLMIRKVMTYTTLFVTILTLIGTLVSLIYTYLGGELSVRFFLKAITVFIVTLSVFGYYLYSVRRDYTKKTFIPFLVTALVTVGVVASLIWSITIIGTPKEMRLRRADSERLSDLSGIQQQVFTRFQNGDKLPKTLGEVNDAFSGYAVPVDPVTKEAYSYRIIQDGVVKMNYTTNKKELVTPAIFELCATFETKRETNGKSVAAYPVATLGGTESFYSVSNYYYEGDPTPFWNHGVGETCFKRVISGEMYYGK
jgi:hypothetical protein